MSEPVRWVIPVILVASAVGTPLALWWERRRAHDQVALDAEQAAEDAAARTSPESRG